MALRRRQVALVLAVLTLAAAAALGGWRWRQAGLRAAGAALFRGEAPLTAALAGHTEPMPVEATRCSNCHEAVQTAPATAGAAAGAPAAPTEAAAPNPSYAARLDRAALAQARRRRGGPPSSYDAATLCTLLRTGVDPAHVIVPTEMPRYDASDAQCDALWAYFGSR